MVQTLVQKGLLNFLGANYFSQRRPHRSPSTKLMDFWTTYFPICESRSPSAREILLSEERRTDHRRVLKNNILHF